MMRLQIFNLTRNLKNIFALDSTSTPTQTQLHWASTQLKLDFNSILVSNQPYLNLNINLNLYLTLNFNLNLNLILNSKWLWHKNNRIFF